VRESRGSEVLLHFDDLVAGVADRETGEQACRRLGEHAGRGAQTVPQAARRRLPPRSGPDRRRPPADAQDRDREVGVLGGREQALGDHLLPR